MSTNLKILKLKEFKQQKISAGIIGLGIGFKHFEAIHKYKKANVLFVCDFDQEILTAFKKKYPKIKTTTNANDIINNKDINLVSIASYDKFHAQQIIKCVSGGKHVIAEKPICLTENELKKIITVCKKNSNIQFTCNYVLRSEDIINFIKKKLSKIKVEKINYLELDYIWGRPWKLKGWRSKTKNYNIILGAAIHMIDALNWITGKLPYEVYAIAKKKKYGKHIKYANCSLLLSYKDGFFSKINVNSDSPHPHFHNISVFTEKFSILNNVNGMSIFDFKKRKVLQSKPKIKYPRKKNRKKLIHDFIDSITNLKKQKIIINDVVNSMSIAFAAIKSIKTSKKVEIKYLKC